DAVILGTRALPDGGVEITAAVDGDRVVAPTQPTAARANAVPERPGVDAGDAPSPLATADDLGIIARELRELGARVRHLDRALRPLALATPLGAEARTLAERLALGGLAPVLCGAVATRFEEARNGGTPAGAALEESLAAQLLPPVTAAPPATITAFVGPTGAGKTTTIAKLAAAQLRAGRGRLGFVMGDTYRVGAAEQLGAYARLLGIPMAVARDAD